MKKQIYDRSPFDSLIATAKRQGYSKGMVAEAIGCSRGTLSQWITGKRTPTVIYRMRFPIVEGRFQRKRGPKYKENDDDSNGFEQEQAENPILPISSYNAADSQMVDLMPNEMETFISINRTLD